MIRVGTSGWSYPTGQGTWNGLFYPSAGRGSNARGRFDELAWYAEHFDTVEVNATFYRIQSPQTALSWAKRTPSGFQFSVKLFQKFTHPELYHRNSGLDPWNLGPDDIDAFRAMLDPLAAAGKLAVLLAQFPPSFKNEPATQEYVEWLLDVFRDYSVAVEFRHRSWSDAAEDIDLRLARHHAGLVLIDEPHFESSIRLDPSLVINGSADRPAYLRLHGRNAANWWRSERSEDRYNYLYEKEELTPFVKTALAAAAPGRKVFVYLNNHFSAKAVANAAIIKAELGQALPGEYQEAMIDRYPDLAGLVRVAGLPLLRKPV